jgi:hypothetical protein
MTVRDILLTRIERFCAAHDMTERRFGLAAVGDHKFIGRLRQGKATLALITRAETFMDSYRPPSPPAEASAEVAA